jgi:hypothetical protein
MSGVPYRKRSGRLQRWAAGVILLSTVCSARGVLAQTPLPPSVAAGEIQTETTSAPASPDSGIIQTGCPGCGSSDLPPPAAAHGDGGCGCGGGCGACKGCGCIPGQPKCYCECCCDPQNCCSRFLCGVYNCICCPDPCYEPHWCALHDAAFFQDAARPVTQMKLTWDSGFHYKDPDRAEFFFARERTNPNEVGPGGPCAKTGVGKGPACIASDVNYEELYFTSEVAQGAAGLSISVPYLAINPQTAPANAGLNPPAANPAQAGLNPAQLAAAFTSMGLTPPSPTVMGCCQTSGFGDIIIGTKAMLLDCDCIQITYGFKTFIPSGNFTTGLGTGHVSLEPEMIVGIPVAQDWFLQMEFAYWIPIGGDPLYESDIFHCHFALNKTLWCPCPGLKIVGTCEVNEWSVVYGAYTEPDFLIVPVTRVTPGPGGVLTPTFGQPSPVAHPAKSTICELGPGFRFVICDKIDIGVGTAFAVTGARWTEELIRAEFRWRF